MGRDYDDFSKDSRRERGVVKWFNVKSGYGFIKRFGNEPDVFVHQSAIIKNNPDKFQRSLAENEEVEFVVTCGDKGDEASQVTGPDGASVKGSDYASQRMSDYRSDSRPRGRGFGQSNGGSYSNGRDRGYGRESREGGYGNYGRDRSNEGSFSRGGSDFKPRGGRGGFSNRREGRNRDYSDSNGYGRGE